MIVDCVLLSRTLIGAINYDRSVRTTEKTLLVVEELIDREPCGVRASGGLKTEKSAVHNHLTTLQKHGYVLKADDEYQLGLKFLEVAAPRGSR